MLKFTYLTKVKKNRKAFGIKTHKILDFAKIFKKKLENKKNFIILDVSNKKILNSKFIKILRSNSWNNQKRILFFDSPYKDNLILKTKLFKSSLVMPYLISSKYLNKFSRIRQKRFGPKYFIFDKQVERINRDSSLSIKKILFSFGASDINNSSYKIIKKIKIKSNNKKITVVLGPFFSSINIKKLKQFAKNNPNINIINYKSNLVKLINSHDLLITKFWINKI